MTSRPAGPAWKALLTRRRAAWIGGILLGIVAVVALWSLVPIGEMIWGFASWIRELGTAGTAVFAGLFVLAVLVMAPASALYMVAGLVFDMAWGFLISLIAATAGSLLQFLIARYLARDRVRRAVERRKEFEAVDRAVEDEGWKVVLLLRLAPLVPGNAQGWLFGVTRVSLLQFAWASIAGIVPWALLFTGLGSAGAAAIYRGDSPLGAWQWALMAAGVVILAGVVWLVGRRARAKLEAMGIDGDGRRGSD